MSEKQTAGHTPGPWTKTRDTIFKFDDGHAIAIAVRPQYTDMITWDRDGSVLAAAPDLLAALHMVETCFGYTFPREEREQIHAALAKAKGERP